MVGAELTRERRRIHRRATLRIVGCHGLTALRRGTAVVALAATLREAITRCAARLAAAIPVAIVAAIPPAPAVPVTAVTARIAALAACALG
ncbi:MAG: hypothetical protein ACRETS_09535, partial [Steroidobacteraceae bacterium]